MDLIKILEVAVNNSNLILVNKKISGDYVKLVVDTEDGVTLKQLTKLTKIIKNNEHVSTMYPDGIKLEVTSPGTDFPLTKAFQFNRNVGRQVRIQHENSNIPNPLQGKILKFEKNKLSIIFKGKLFTLDLSEIEICHLIYQRTSEE
tara:strand:+ start:536 stop:973 length:438 start_codon:yes stop_codon:yes gene_type:complete